MNREETIKWLKSLKAEIGKSEHKSLWHYAEAIDTAIEALDAETVQGYVISKQFVSDAILQRISELNAQGEKSIPIAREFIRFKRFVDGITPIRVETVQGEWIDVDNEPYCECSVCGSYIDNLDDDYAFCPRCGARMTPYKGGDEE